jgi:tetrahydromethanopterin S-methyltransferase subunit A
MLREKEIPVYLFTGFLESGKTKFIQETLEDEKFNPKDRTLLLVCEEGEEEYETIKFSNAESVDIAFIEDKADLTEEKLAAIALIQNFETNTFFKKLPNFILISLQRFSSY